MKTLFYIISICYLVSSTIQACEHGFFPQNDLFITAYSENPIAKNAKSANLVQLVGKIYIPIFKQFNKKLQINFKLENTAVNAYATRDDSNNPVINISGGMVNHKLLTQDGLALILCHELGHFLGGEPKKLRGRSTKKSWSSAEGQADYFAVANCIKKVFRQLPETFSTEKNNSLNKNEKEARMQAEADSVCKTPMCRRVAFASLNVTEVYASIDFYSRELSLVYADNYTVYQTVYGHPNPQCRLDTMIAALQCPNAESIEFKDGDPISGACSNPEFRRPRCWYYPAISF